MKDFKKTYENLFFYINPIRHLQSHHIISKQEIPQKIIKTIMFTSVKAERALSLMKNIRKALLIANLS